MAPQQKASELMDPHDRTQKRQPLFDTIEKELASLADDCELIQSGITQLLSAELTHEHLSSIQKVQLIDRTQQSLVDLAALVGAISLQLSDVELDPRDVSHVMKLESLRTRLCEDQNTKKLGPEPSKSVDMMWLET